MIFCTTCDFNYLPKGLCLYESISAFSNSFHLYWLCIDEKTYNKLIELNLPNVTPVNLIDLENQDINLVNSKNIQPRLYGDSYSQYCWCLTPYFVNYVLNKLNPEDTLFYCDADIYFINNPNIIFNALENKSVAIHTHRFSGNFDDDNVAGWYNVGVVGFKKNAIGMEVSESWKNWLLDTNNPYYEKYGTCGDQKYLNLFPKLWGTQNICVFDEELNILHLAAWCTHNPDNKEPLFYHFSHFVTDFATWRDSLHNEWNPSALSHIKPYYEQYFNKHLVIKEKYKL